MKKIISTTFLLLLLVGSSSLYAQELVHFKAGKCKNDLPKEVASALENRLVQIIARNNTGATSMYNAFEIIPHLTIGETISSEGLINQVTLIKGELSLTAINKYDGSVYGNTVVNLQTSGTGDKNSILASLVRSIKITDPVYARFLNNAKNAIIDFYSQNCATILSKAETLIATHKYEDALNYLSCIPQVVPCYEQVTAAIAKVYTMYENKSCATIVQMAKAYYIQQQYDKALAELVKIQSDSQCATDVKSLMDSIDMKLKQAKLLIASTDVVPPTPTVTGAPTPTPTPAAAPVPVQAPAPVIAPTPATKPAPAVVSSAVVEVGCNDLKVTFLNCVGNRTSQTVDIMFTVENKARHADGVYYALITAISDDGQSIDRYMWLKSSGEQDYYSTKNLPTDIVTSGGIRLGGVWDKVKTISYLEMEIRKCKVVLKNIPIVWN